jgi:hypothetical protein
MPVPASRSVCHKHERMKAAQNVYMAVSLLLNNIVDSITDDIAPSCACASVVDCRWWCVCNTRVSRACQRFRSVYCRPRRPGSKTGECELCFTWEASHSSIKWSSSSLCLQPCNRDWQSTLHLNACTERAFFNNMSERDNQRIVPSILTPASSKA